jgi:methanogenic corrinoid protein MtbC1
MDKQLVDNYIDALIQGNRQACHRIVADLLAGGTEIRTLYSELFQHSLYQVGELWETNRISVAVEHLATSITESLMSLVYPRLFSAEHIGKKAVISCAVNESHQIGAKMVADLFELNGWDGHFLGVNTPVPDQIRFIHDTRPDVAGFSLSIHSTLPMLVEHIDAIRSTFKDLPIIFGGQAFRWGGVEKMDQFSETRYIASLDDLETFISRMSK